MYALVWVVSELLRVQIKLTDWLRCDIIIPEAFEVKPQDLRKFVDHQLFLCFGKKD